MHKNRFYEEYLEQLPEGMRKAVGSTILKFKGAEMPISRMRLAMLVGGRLMIEYHDEKQFGNLDRRMRRAIELLRGSGWLIGSSLEGDGYFMIQTAEEYAQFRAVYTSSAYQVLETAKTMDASAERLFHPQAARQMALLAEDCH